tara:strand:+ start:11674 stop:11994 length:321 start_codon:yes stop_codon:yes gene_type:complete
MRIHEKNQYTLVKIEKKSFVDFIKQFSKFKTNHLFLHLSKDIIIDDDKISTLSNIAIEFKSKALSFVVIKNDIDIDIFPENINISPTLQEAEDILEMDTIERDLRF